MAENRLRNFKNKGKDSSVGLVATRLVRNLSLFLHAVGSDQCAVGDPDNMLKRRSFSYPVLTLQCSLAHRQAVNEASHCQRS